MNIDWSKAPEGATHWVNSLWPWHKHIDNVAYYWDEGRHSWVKLIHQATIIEHEYRTSITRRPSTEWCGIGLPPVGAKGTHGEYTEVFTVFGVDGEWIAVSSDFSRFWMHYSELRPIRTQEQIEAEERKAALEEMFQVSYAGDIWHILGSLYDAGYRKQPKEDA